MNQPVHSPEQRLVALLAQHPGASLSPAALSEDHFFAELGDFNLLVMPAARRPGWVLLEFELLSLGLADPTSRLEPLRMLHHLNHTARGAHPWVISIDEEACLVLTACVPTARVLGSDPIGFLDMGLTKAHEVVYWWRTADARSSSAAAPQAPAMPEAGYLWG